MKFLSTILAILLTIFFAGCATPTKEFVYSNNSEKGIYQPTRILINRDDYIPRFYIRHLEEAIAEFKRNGLFLDISAVVDSPYVLDVKLNRGTTDTIIDTTAQILSAATLFIVPSKVHNFNTLTVDFYNSGRLIKSYKYEEHYEETLSIKDMLEEDGASYNEFLSIRNLVNIFLRDFDHDNLIPRITKQQKKKLLKSL